MSTQPMTIRELAYQEAVRQLSGTESSVSRQADLLLGALEGDPNPTVRTKLTEYFARSLNHQTGGGAAPRGYSYEKLSEAGSLKSKVAYAASLRAVVQPHHPGTAPSVMDLSMNVSSAISNVLFDVELLLSEERMSRDNVLRQAALANFDPQLSAAERAELDAVSIGLSKVFQGTPYGDNLHAGRERDAQRVFKLSTAVSAAGNAGIAVDAALADRVAKLSQKLDPVRAYYASFGAVNVARNAFFAANRGEKLLVPSADEVKKLSRVLAALGTEGGVAAYLDAAEKLPGGLESADVALDEFHQKGIAFNDAVAKEGWSREQFNSVFSRHVTQELLYRKEARFREARAQAFGVRAGEFARDYADLRAKQRDELARTPWHKDPAARDQAVDALENIFANDRSLFTAARGTPHFEKFVTFLDAVFQRRFPAMYSTFAKVPAGVIPSESREMAEAVIEQNQAEHDALFSEEQTMRVRNEMSPAARRSANVHAVSTKIRDEGLPVLKKAADVVSASLKGLLRVGGAASGAVGDMAKSADKALKDEVGGILSPLKLLRLVTKPLAVVGKGGKDALKKTRELYGKAEEALKETVGLDNPVQAFAYLLASVPYAVGTVGRQFSASAEKLSEAGRRELFAQLFTTCNQNGQLNEALERVAFHETLKDFAPRFELESGELEAPTKPSKAVKKNAFEKQEGPKLAASVEKGLADWSSRAAIRARSLVAPGVRTGAAHLSAQTGLLANVRRLQDASATGSFAHLLGAVIVRLKSGQDATSEFAALSAAASALVAPAQAAVGTAMGAESRATNADAAAKRDLANANLAVQRQQETLAEAVAYQKSVIGNASEYSTARAEVLASRSALGTAQNNLQGREQAVAAAAEALSVAKENTSAAVEFASVTAQLADISSGFVTANADGDAAKFVEIRKAFDALYPV